MSVKKLVTLTVAGIASVSAGTIALAGGPEYATPSYAGVYIEGNLGYAYRPWQNDVTTTYGVLNQAGLLSSSSNINGGFTGGADIGYQFNQFFSIEGGWYYLPKASGSFSGTVQGLSIDPTSSNISSGLAYAAVKGTAPIYDNTYIFGKLGAAYTYNTASGNGVPNSNFTGLTSESNYWNPMLGAGIQYYFTPGWSVNVQYDYIPGYRSASSSAFVAPDTQLITAGLGYKFLM